MGDEDWFRRTNWTDRDQIEFFERLARSRGLSNKSQYARIQALTLQNAGLFAESLALLDRLFKDWPDPFQMASARMQQGQCYAAVGQIPAALGSYRAAIELEKENPGWTTGVRLEFAWTVVTRKLEEMYSEAMVALDADIPLGFPIQEYKYAAAHALIYDGLGKHDAAKRFARSALDAAAKTESGFRNHQRLGLVDAVDGETHERLLKLAAD